MGVSGVIRQYMHGVNLEAARLFATKAREIQDAGSGLRHEQRSHKELHAFVSGSILHSTGFMEAMINEFLVDIVDSHNAGTEPVNPLVADRIRVIWRQVLQRSASILPKYQVALSAFDAPVFDHGQPPYQGAAVLVKLRNYLVHHKTSLGSDPAFCMPLRYALGWIGGYGPRGHISIFDV